MNNLKMSLKGMFVCNNCCCHCSNGEDSVGPFGPDKCVGDYFSRKQYIGYLGKYCDALCELQTS
jgi:hypothetical protein